MIRLQSSTLLDSARLRRDGSQGSPVAELLVSPQAGWERPLSWTNLLNREVETDKNVDQLSIQIDQLFDSSGMH